MSDYKTLHIIGVQFSSFTRSVQLLCEELGLAYSLGPSFDQQEYNLRSPALRAINPFGKVPVLMLDDVQLFETQTILRYLDARFNQGRFQSPDLLTNAFIDQWCSAITCQIDRAIVRDYLLEFLFPKGADGQPDFVRIEQAIPALQHTIKIVEAQLGNQPWLLGQTKTLADFLLIPCLHYLVQAPKNEHLILPNSPIRRYVENWLTTTSAQKVLVQPKTN